MEFKCTAGDFLAAINRVRPAASSSALVTAGVQISATDGPVPVRLTACDGSLSLTCGVGDGQFVSEGAVLVAPNPVRSFLQGLPSDTGLTVRTDSTHMLIDRGKGKPYSFVFALMDFVDLKPPADNQASVDLGDLHAALHAVKPSADGEGMVQVVSGDKDLDLLTTDRFRMTRARLFDRGFGECRVKLRLPSVEEIAKIKPSRLRWDASLFHAADTGSAAMTCRQHTAPFPPAAEKILDSVADSHLSLTFDRLDALEASKRLASLSSDQIVSLSVDADGMLLASVVDDTGSGFEEFDVIGGPAETFSTNLRLSFLVDALSAIPSDVVEMHFVRDPKKPIFFSGRTEALQVECVLSAAAAK